MKAPISKLLVIIDMQNDFITGSLANEEGQKIVPKMANFIRNFNDSVVFTKDTHLSESMYDESQEGKNLPIYHCLRGTEGNELVPEIQEVVKEKLNIGRGMIMTKYAFGTVELGFFIKSWKPQEVILCGVCTDICVVTNAMVIKTICPETPITVLTDLCAGTTIEKHNAAIETMKSCQIKCINSIDL